MGDVSCAPSLLHTGAIGQKAEFNMPLHFLCAEVRVLGEARSESVRFRPFRIDDG